MEKYTEVRVIGQGGFGTATLVKLKLTQEEFVVKRINSGLHVGATEVWTQVFVNEERNKQALAEVNVLKQLKHENIVSYIESFEEKGCLHIVMSYCSGGNLATKIKNRGSNLFPEFEILKICRQLCSAVDYLHFKKILHRDIKPENIFLTRDDVIKLGDFGLSKVLDESMQYARTIAGTYVYMSPEILNGQKYTNKSDMWSLVCVLYELTALKRAFTCVADVIRVQFSPVPSVYSTELRDLISQLFSLNPDDRPSAHEVWYKLSDIDPGPYSSDVMQLVIPGMLPSVPGFLQHSFPDFSPIPLQSSSISPGMVYRSPGHSDRPSAHEVSFPLYPTGLNTGTWQFRQYSLQDFGLPPSQLSSISPGMDDRSPGHSDRPSAHEVSFLLYPTGLNIRVF